MARCLQTGDEEMSFEKAEELVQLVGLQRFYVDSVTGVMTETGKLWVDGEIGIAQEHMITNIMRKIIQHYNACLLYTSPSPRDGLLSRMPSSA